MYLKKNQAICSGTNEIMNERLAFIEANTSISLSAEVKSHLIHVFNSIENMYKLKFQMDHEKDVENKILCKLQTGKYIVRYDSDKYNSENILIGVFSIHNNDTIKCNFQNSGDPQNLDSEVIYYSFKKLPSRIQKEKKSLKSLEADIVNYIRIKTGMESKASFVNFMEPESDKSIDFNVPKTIKTEITRFIRDTKISRKLKKDYDNTCQICEHKIPYPIGKYYIEVHHIKPLGKGGPDEKENMIVVCPNHHAVLDYLAREINLKDLKIEKHTINQEFVDFHNELFTRKTHFE